MARTSAAGTRLEAAAAARLVKPRGRWQAAALAALPGSEAPCRSPSRSRWTRSRASTSTPTAPSRWRSRPRGAATASTTICRASCSYRNGRVAGDGAAVRGAARARATTSPWATPEQIDLAAMDVVLMRQDPPFNLAYISTTHLLDRIHPSTLVVNDPTSVRNSPEKLFVTQFAELMPPTLITYDLDEIRAFRREHGDIIVKPIYGNGGAGVFHVKPDDTNLASPDRAVPDLPQRAPDGAALPPGDPAGRQAHHPDRRQAGGSGEPGAGAGRDAGQPARRRPGREGRADQARPRDLRGAGPGARASAG